MISVLGMAYDWQAAGVAVMLALATIFVGRTIFFRIPAIRKTVEIDERENKNKIKTKDQYYRKRLKSSRQIGIGFNLVFVFSVLPFIATLQIQPVWRVALDCFLILMVYDLFYYLMHRFLFHKQKHFKKIHGVHHMARSRVSSTDAYLLHPVEIFLGIFLYFLVTVGFVLLYGERLQSVTLALGFVVYSQLNIVNHCRVDLSVFPWKTLNWVAMKHDAHHLSMQHGNYATITLLFDWMFGTLETHPREIQFKG